MYKQTEINWHLVTLLEMQYIHNLYVINQYFMSSNMKTKNMTVSMNTVAMIKIEVKVWTQKSEFPQRNFLRYLTPTEITR